MGLFRSEEISKQYALERETEEFKTVCALCYPHREPIHTYTHWKMIAAKYPYDKIAEVHHMLLPKRHTTEQGLTVEEMAEFMEIKYSEEIQSTYDNFIESTHRTRSIPPHFHLHLTVLKKG